MINKTPTIEELLTLWSLCVKFIEGNDIFHAENIYDNDRVIENAYGLMDSMCNIVGFTDYEEEYDNDD